MSSKRENILSYIATQLASTSGISSRAYRSRVEPFRREETPCLLIEPVQDTADYNTMDFINWTLQFRVTIYARGTVPDSVADPIWVSLYSILMDDRTLGGRVQDIIPNGVQYQFTEGDQPILLQSCLFTCNYRTTAQDAEA